MSLKLWKITYLAYSNFFRSSCGKMQWMHSPITFGWNYEKLVSSGWWFREQVPLNFLNMDVCLVVLSSFSCPSSSTVRALISGWLHHGCKVCAINLVLVFACNRFLCFGNSFLKRQMVTGMRFECGWIIHCRKDTFICFDKSYDFMWIASTH